jgi:Mat/Ecp fimbriae periplasmic chaperone
MLQRKQRAVGFSGQTSRVKLGSLKALKHWRSLATGLALTAAALAVQPAHAEMILSQVIVDFLPGLPERSDIEVWNSGDARMYVAADPFEIRNPGTADEQRVPVGEDEASGLLVSPRKLILEPGERRLIRIVALGPRPASDRVYRVAIKPVGGPINARVTALKVFVGYDALVLHRPGHIEGEVVGERSARTLTLVNHSNTAQEVFDGQQCENEGARCSPLPMKRLYPGVSWTQELPHGGAVTYKLRVGSAVDDRRF